MNTSMSYTNLFLGNCGKSKEIVMLTMSFLKNPTTTLKMIRSRGLQQLSYTCIIITDKNTFLHCLCISTICTCSPLFVKEKENKVVFKWLHLVDDSTALLVHRV